MKINTLFRTANGGMFLLFLLSSCASSKIAKPLRSVDALIQSAPELQESFTGFVLYDPAEQSFLYEQYPDKYMTPASNTKLYTFFAGLHLLGDSIPAIQYVQQNDTLYFWGMGDPSFLNTDFGAQDPLYQFLQSRTETLVYIPRPMLDLPLGPGWSWDDFVYYYSTERSRFPIYGNNMSLRFSVDTFWVQPAYFQGYLKKATIPSSPFLSRNFHDNIYHINLAKKGGQTERLAPFHYSDTLFVSLLTDTLQKPIHLRKGELLPSEGRQTFYSYPIDTLYRKMLQPSDNFYAEQILLMASAMLSDTLSAGLAIDFVKDSLFRKAPSPLVWVDGSGLSRYNMFTPRTTVKLLECIYQKIPPTRWQSLLPAGGVSGTIKNWYGRQAGEGDPYVFAKTGTLSNNHCLSGFLKAKSGKVLIFSFMHNHYRGSSSGVKQLMTQVLASLHEMY